jgi:hypothetical protein
MHSIKRNRIVLFRVTEPEYRVLAQLCAVKGGRSIAEFARGELLSPSKYLDMVPLRDAIASMELRVLNLSGQQNELARQVQSIAGLDAAGSPSCEEEDST